MSIYETIGLYAFALILMAVGLFSALKPLSAWHFANSHFERWERMQFKEKEIKLISRFIGCAFIFAGILIAVMNYLGEIQT